MECDGVRYGVWRSGGSPNMWKPGCGPIIGQTDGCTWLTRGINPEGKKVGIQMTKNYGKPNERLTCIYPPTAADMK